MDRFFTQTTCDRCGGSLKNGRIMSMYNTDCICMECKKKERERSDYKKASDTEREMLMKGVRNYKGIGW